MADRYVRAVGGNSNAAGTWELTITFTPSEAGVVEIEAWAYWLAGTADESVYVDDMTITVADTTTYDFKSMDWSFQAQPFVVNEAAGGTNDVFGWVS